ncbi:hypothetical protein MMAG44476_10989 [Mycolicibacterium mageritense DSM 44476 = CIP 104973]|uniref:Uncharacterized protein n=1 Tax=Mycolicibacterium mageritense TaxID=53462 RepID=A0AAI8XQ54_MYCME|nr:hypothetical protein [Mycolicibacterium mageritense]MCC9181667.1 hypothetical protein [Mycolicibacterium mageritense]CDO19722.1 hypothetical protein BN978_00172 [Mycolicibacterium mageritense DSM 44476 = CIP 104973]BBX35773.1 hypothetical protein MMAGJ_50550 [Mycolicibacterium mageritense]BDY30655.1 hypothetical protein hbim_04600 [Mycolicibacterium mageritense]GJJ19383.1 hypothetical protein MTY414_30560 [Mycolicibacterium mageritense]
MTTHDNTTDDPTTRDRGDSAPAAADKPTAAETTQPMMPVSDEEAEQATTDEPLFADDNRSRLRSRWDELQAAFVDDPKQCVEKADSLVAEVVDQLTSSFSDARSRLEAQWARGEDASTEELRVALKRYREFFQRLLSV